MEITPVFWNTQGEIKYDTEKNFFNYETSMSVNWNNKLARKVLITLMRLFNRPAILDINTDGIAIWTYKNLKDSIFFKLPSIFYEITLRDEYLFTKKNLLFLTVSYHVELNETYINSINNYHNYINYDSNKKMLSVKSRTLEENLVILNIFLTKNKLSKSNISKALQENMISLNRKKEKEFILEIQNYINNISTITNLIKNPKFIKNNEEEILVEEEEKYVFNE